MKDFWLSVCLFLGSRIKKKKRKSTNQSIKTYVEKDQITGQPEYDPPSRSISITWNFADLNLGPYHRLPGYKASACLVGEWVHRTLLRLQLCLGLSRARF